MANDLNQCSFIGRLGKDVELRYMASGDAAASFSIAVGSQWKNKEGDKQESTEWVNITAFGKLGEICGEYLSRGSQIFISGHLKTDKYTAKDGTDRYSTKVIADRMQMLGGKRSAERGDPAEPEAGGQRAVPGGPVNMGKPSFDNFDDDIPF